MKLKINHPLLNAAFKVVDVAAAATGNPEVQKKVKAWEADVFQRTDEREARLPEPVQRALYVFGELGKKVGL
jgi:hypothetical protein